MHMKAIVITEKVGPEVLKIKEIDQPVALGNQVLVKIKAAGVNRSDVLMRKNNSYAKFTSDEVPGLEIAGIVAAVGPDVKRWKIGDAVCALIAGGGYAQFKAVDERLCLSVP